ncbi:MAG: glutamine-hydrolyzing GMP synthase [Armatimonadetes bacterium]|nr:MAG: glutamine-hydrolyzing GMP synthase [Armatimonadota bacterium]
MNLTKRHEPLLVVDFGGQYTQLIARKARELNVFAKIVPWNSPELEREWDEAKAVVLSGGPRSVTEPDSPSIPEDLLASGKPVLGICYGLQLIAKLTGGRVVPGKTREYGEQTVGRVSASSLLPERFVAWMSHGDAVEEVPSGFEVTGASEACPVAAIEDPSRRLFGVQFHPEVSHTEGGKEILRRFLYDVAGFQGDWTSTNFIEETVEAIRDQVGPQGKVLCAVSGGVDSSVCAALIAQAIGDRLRCVFVDHGLLRYREAEEVCQMFRKHIPAEFIMIDASEQFLNALKGITDPEEKRKTIGAEFIRVFEAHADELQGCDFLAQGTLYPDVIESGSPTAATIKSHHNVGGLPDWMRMELVEPLRWLFKDEVRQVGLELGLPREMILRQPFPGPGLAVRILGEVTRERVEIVQQADWIFREELRKAGLEEGIWQSYAALLNVRSVGVMGDERTYEHPIVLRAVVSEDAMTARAAEIPFEVLQRVARRIVNEVRGVNRVLYDLTSKPPATIEWE